MEGQDLRYEVLCPHVIVLILFVFPQMLALSDAVICYAAYCDQMEQLGPLVERVVNKHVSFGVKSEHYPVVGGALLQALEVHN